MTSDEEPRASAQSIVSPPYWRLALAYVPPAVAIVFLLDWARGALIWPVTGWVLAAIGGLVLFGLFTVEDVRARATGWYIADQRILRIAIGALLVLILVVTLLCSLQIADLVSRSDWFAKEAS